MSSLPHCACGCTGCGPQRADEEERQTPVADHEAPQTPLDTGTSGETVDPTLQVNQWAGVKNPGRAAGLATTAALTEHHSLCITREVPRPRYDDGELMPCDCRLIRRLGLNWSCPTTTPEPHWLGEFPMTCWNCHVEADS